MAGNYLSIQIRMIQLLILHKIVKKCRKFITRHIKPIIIFAVLIFVYLIGVPAYINHYSKTSVVSYGSIKPNEYEYAVVLGTAVQDNETPTKALKDRLDTAIKMFNESRIDKIVITGDETKMETSVMESYLLDKGISENSIIMDYTATRTYENCRHAKNLGVNRAIIVTQEYHLNRSIYICNHIGINSVGVSASKDNYQQQTFWNIREFFAKHKAFLEIGF